MQINFNEQLSINNGFPKIPRGIMKPKKEEFQEMVMFDYDSEYDCSQSNIESDFDMGKSEPRSQAKQSKISSDLSKGQLDGEDSNPEII